MSNRSASPYPSMRKILFRVLVAVITFAIGFSAVWMMPAFTMSSINIDSLAVEETKSELRESKKHRFLTTYRACKPGYIQGYETDEGDRLSEGTAPAADIGFGLGYHQLIREARTPHVFVSKYRDHTGRIGERHILKNEPNEQGEESVTILFYDGGDYYRFINAPTMELALEFEQYLIGIDSKSPM